MSETKRLHILNTVEDLVSNFLYYDRKEDDCLRPQMIEEAIRAGIISTAEIVDKFRGLISNSVDLPVRNLIFMKKNGQCISVPDHTTAAELFEKGVGMCDADGVSPPEPITQTTDG